MNDFLSNSTRASIGANRGFEIAAL